jgi:hypothetical protein
VDRGLGAQAGERGVDVVAREEARVTQLDLVEGGCVIEAVVRHAVSLAELAGARRWCGRAHHQ